MRTRVLAASLALVAVIFAGCAGNSDLEPVNNVVDLLHEEGLVASHPMFNYVTNAALVEAPEPGMLYQDVDGVRHWFKPAYRGFPEGISGMEPLATANVEGGGRGIYVFGSLVFSGPNAGPLSVVDISDPLNPTIIGTSTDTPVRDADVIVHPTGNLTLISTAGGRNIVATDVTDPTSPAILSDFETTYGNHNIAVVPGTPIVYNTGSGDRINIIDYTDPVNPIEVGEFVNGNACHDVAFFISQVQEKYWAICAGYEDSEIWDISDPLAPVMYVEIAYPSIDKGLPIVGERIDDYAPDDLARPVADVVCEPAGMGDGCITAAHPSSFSHLAIINHDATVLIMGDETGGGGSNQCDFYYEGPDGQVMSGPIGNLWFYDITDPEDPDLRGHVSPGRGDAEGSCTAHFGKQVGETDYLVMAFYSAGITLIDFEDLSNPRIVDRWDEGGNIWDVQFHQGYLFTGDMSSGMDVLALS